MIRIFLSVLLFLSCVIAVPALAQKQDAQRLEEVTAQQKQAEALARKLAKERNKTLKELAKLQDDLVRESAKARGYEQKEALEKQSLAELTHKEAEMKASIFSDKKALADLLSALQRVDTNPPPAILAHKKNALEAARAASLMSALTTDLHARSDKLRSDLQALTRLKRQKAEQHKKVEASTKAVNARLARLKTLVRKKTELGNKLDQDRKKTEAQAKKLAREAKTLRELINRFEQNAKELGPAPTSGYTSTNPVPRLKPRAGQPSAPVYTQTGSGRFADARGHIPLPVAGRIIRKFGTRQKDGSRAKGITLKTAKRAQVFAPFSGRVEFSGPFNDDNVVILNTGGGYFIVLSGLGETFAHAGTRVKAGEALGLMPARSGRASELFMEFRKNHTSINPAPWLQKWLQK